MATWLVTGASRGLGLEFARQLTARGDKVIGTARRPQEALDLRKTGAEVVALEADKPGSIEALTKHLANRPIDVLVNNAGVSADDKQLGMLSFEAFEKVFHTNVFGTALVAQALLPNLRAGNRQLILNISSQLGSLSAAYAGFSYAYNASKAALNMITARMAKDLAKEHFVVVSMHPGWVKTDMGGPNAPLTPEDSIKAMLGAIDRLSIKDNGGFRNYDGAPMAW
jgi:NAD(P)-dependent dehydrogenase (short-subunit alcohol dehydrogenase family)